MSKHDLLIRVSSFSSDVLRLINIFPRKPHLEPLLDQLTRACTSLSLNYSEAMAAESRKDFIHKMSISLKELRETYTCLLLLRNINEASNKVEFVTILDENDQLISIFVQSILTAKANLKRNTKAKPSPE